MRALVSEHRCHVGCSGWQYRHWRGNVYPRELSQARWFDRYASVFDTVEINNSFYRLPEAATFEGSIVRCPGSCRAQQPATVHMDRSRSSR